MCPWQGSTEGPWDVQANLRKVPWFLESPYREMDWGLHGMGGGKGLSVIREVGSMPVHTYPPHSQLLPRHMGST